MREKQRCKMLQNHPEKYVNKQMVSSQRGLPGTSFLDVSLVLLLLLFLLLPLLTVFRTVPDKPFFNTTVNKKQFTVSLHIITQNNNYYTQKYTLIILKNSSNSSNS